MTTICPWPCGLGAALEIAIGAAEIADQLGLLGVDLRDDPVEQQIRQVSSGKYKYRRRRKQPGHGSQGTAHSVHTTGTRIPLTKISGVCLASRAA
jgi:DNA-directed RNA polymerase subunit K/omega